MEQTKFIKNILMNSNGISIAIVGDNERFLKDTIKNIILDITSSEIDKYLFIDTEESPNIKIDDVRNIQDFLSFSPDKGTKFAVIFNAEKLLPEAENALLKTLEEPPDYAIIILVTTNWNALFSTIKSRVFRFNLNIPNDLFKNIDNFFLKKLIWTFPDKVEELKNKDFKVIELDKLHKEKDIFNVFYTIYHSIKDSIGDLKKLNSIANSFSKIKDFDFLKTISKVSLWIAEEFSYFQNVDYNSIKDIEKISSSKKANYNYELTYYYILFSLNDSIKKD
ncbi:MAG: polymerase subunit delta [Thermosipho sp. (in: thermotogales)]|nr:polymerase subunit delta [Thermosipho sp. (in: thermotogales)]